jgi:hypothetical protein
MAQDFNKVIFLGRIYRPVTICSSNGKTYAKFTLITNTSGAAAGFINVLIAEDSLIKVATDYIIEANTNKRVIVTGTYMYVQSSAPNTVLMTARYIDFIDKLISQKEADRLAEDKIDFSQD